MALTNRGGELKVSELAELAGVLSAQAFPIAESPSACSPESLARLNAVAIERSEVWLDRLRNLKSGISAWGSLYSADESPLSRLIEEILVSEILGRMTAALVTSQAEIQGSREVQRSASLFFQCCLRDRKLALGEMVEMADAQDPAVRRLDRTRRLAERWTDMLLGPLLCRFSTSSFVFDKRRSREFGVSLLPHLTAPTGLGILSAGLQIAFPDSLIGVPSHAGLHRDLASAVLNLLPDKAFDRMGRFQSLRSIRASRHSIPTSPGRKRQAVPAPKSTASEPSKNPIELSFRDLRKSS